MPWDNERWKLIAIEWIDGSWKWTQVRLLVENLKKALYDVEIVDFPQYGKNSAILLEAYLNWKFWTDPNALWAKIPSAMFALDRVAAAPQIEQWLKEWKMVIANRYTTSNMWHQAWKIHDLDERDKFLDWVDKFEYDELHIPRPDAVVYIDMPPKIAQENVDKKTAKEREYAWWKKRDIHEADLNHLINSADAYRYVADKYNWLKLNPAPDWVLRSIDDNQKALLDLLLEKWIIDRK